MDWITLSEEHMAPAPAAARHLAALDKGAPLNLIAVFGAARQGKSFLMNELAGGSAGFRVSNKSDPCTVGVDLASKLMPLSEFTGGEANRAGAGAGTDSGRIQIGFVDAEGQGDRDQSYDAKIATPILLSAQCVLFNWRDSLQKDRILELLGVLTRAASSIGFEGDDAEAGGGEFGGDDGESGGGGGGGGGGGEGLSGKAKATARGPAFGNLHIVFRDWNFEFDPAHVRALLLDPEKQAPGDKKDAQRQRRNEVRRVLASTFESIHVWLLPPPVERTADLSKVLSHNMLSKAFNSKVSELRATLSAQLATPKMWAGRPITGPALAKLVPVVCEALNRNESVMPKSMYESMLEDEADALHARTEASLDTLCSTLCEKLLTTGVTTDTAADATLKNGENPNGLGAVFDGELVAQCTQLLVTYQAELTEIWNEPAFVNEQIKRMKQKIKHTATQAARQFHRTRWPDEKLRAREALESQGRALMALLPMATNDLRQRINASRSDAASQLRAAGAKGALSKGEVAEALGALVQNGKRVLRDLAAASDKIRAAKREAEAVLLQQAQAAISAQMSAEANGALPARLSEARVNVLLDMVSERLGTRLVDEHGSTPSRVVELTSILSASTRQLEGQLLQQAERAAQEKEEGEARAQKRARYDDQAGAEGEVDEETFETALDKIEGRLSTSHGFFNAKLTTLAEEFGGLVDGIKTMSSAEQAYSHELTESAEQRVRKSELLLAQQRESLAKIQEIQGLAVTHTQGLAAPGL